MCLFSSICCISKDLHVTANWNNPMESSTEISQRAKNRSTVRSSNSTSVYLLEENENTDWKRYL